ncbi:MAG TPA: hypothetical protein DCE41_16910 [Cytophagales bacterium]|nr:hypothetical protein [Cytophagales bacterium]HAP60907.1 hypothetical protein [Cytophagales bacterium]
MGIIKNVQNDREVVLHLRHTVGREDYNILVQPAPDVSRQHGTIFWEGNRWVYHDHSSNGTLIDDAYRHQEYVPLERGMLTYFGQHREHTWKVVSTDAPRPFLESVTDPSVVMLLSDDQMLMQTGDTTVLFFQDAEHQWQANQGERTVALETEQIYAFGETSWRFYLNTPLRPTESNRQLLEESEVLFQQVSEDGEWHVMIQARNIKLDLDVHVYHKILAILATRMQEDIEKGLPEEERGWMDNEEVMTALNPEYMDEMDPYYINTQIYRYRKETKALSYGPMFANLVERRRGRLRFNHPNIKFVSPS